MDSETFEKQLKKTLDQYLVQTTEPLAQSIRYSLLGPGKRIRPRILFACGHLVGLSEETLLAPAISLEMIHCFTLIHDDLPCMDNSDYRRGRLANHKQFSENLALLAGDALLALAIEVFLMTREHTSAEHCLAALKCLLQAIGPQGVVGGQASENLFNETSNLESLHHLHDQKTGALFLVALEIPKILAGLSEQSISTQALISFGASLGRAFQITDDLLDAELKPSPTSILFYTSPQQAYLQMKQDLHEKTNALQKAWSERSLPLKAIADEILLSAYQVISPQPSRSSLIQH